LICDDLLELRILFLEILQPLGLVRPHATVLLTPAVVRLLCDANLTAGLSDPLTLLQQNLRLTQFLDDLLGAVSLSLHALSLLPGQSQIVTFALDRIYGERSLPYAKVQTAVVRNALGQLKHKPL
jgi:hypothetical protein